MMEYKNTNVLKKDMQTFTNICPTNICMYVYSNLQELGATEAPLSVLR